MRFTLVQKAFASITGPAGRLREYCSPGAERGQTARVARVSSMTESIPCSSRHRIEIEAAKRYNMYVLRGAIFGLALILAVASAGTTLCEMDCTASEHSDATVASTDTASNVDVMTCHGGESDSALHNSSSPQGQSHRSPKHTGGHLHARIVATAAAKAPAARAVTISISSNLLSSIPLPTKRNAFLQGNRIFPPINLSSAFATGVLRI
jgi:hypothetical protein